MGNRIVGWTAVLALILAFAGVAGAQEPAPAWDAPADPAASQPRGGEGQWQLTDPGQEPPPVKTEDPWTPPATGPTDPAAVNGYGPGGEVQRGGWTNNAPPAADPYANTDNNSALETIFGVVVFLIFVGLLMRRVYRIASFARR
jgi:hypothetical protein